MRVIIQEYTQTSEHKPMSERNRYSVKFFCLVLGQNLNADSVEALVSPYRDVLFSSYRVGGQWHRILFGVESCSRCKSGAYWHLFSPEHELLSSNKVSVNSLLFRITPWAIVTPDGEWQSASILDQYGKELTEVPEDWAETVDDILDKWQECEAVALEMRV